MAKANKVEDGNLTRRGAGRPKGTPNKTTALLKDAIIAAAQAVGEDGKGKGALTGYCKYLAAAEPKAFAALLGRVLPTQVTGEGGGDIMVSVRIGGDATH